MRRKILLVLIAALLFVGVADAQKRKTVKLTKKPPVKKVVNYIADQEEYAVYEAVLKETFKDKQGQTIVLNKEVTGCGTAIDRDIEREISRDVLEELFSDCYAKKWGNYELVVDSFQYADKVILATEKDLDQVFSPNCDVKWKKFYKKYPNSNGNTSFSRIGFDSRKTFAVVNFGFQSACSGGTGKIIFLQKENEVWRVKKSQTTWAS